MASDTATQNHTYLLDHLVNFGHSFNALLFALFSIQSLELFVFHIGLHIEIVDVDFVNLKKTRHYETFQWILT